MCHARKERVRMFGTRSANYIRASSHNGCIQRPNTWLHPNASLKCQIFPLHCGRRPYMALRLFFGPQSTPPAYPKALLGLHNPRRSTSLTISFSLASRVWRNRLIAAATSSSSVSVTLIACSESFALTNFRQMDFGSLVDQSPDPAANLPYRE